MTLTSREVLASLCTCGLSLPPGQHKATCPATAPEWEHARQRIREVLPATVQRRRRCAVSDCRHAPSAHESGPCQLCACGGWLERKPHTWRDLVTDAWMTATLSWLSHREAAAIGYQTEMREFEENHPRPRLADFMDAMSPGRPPEDLEALTSFQVCTACRGTGHANDDTLRSTG